ncbi:MAG: adenine nucleotide alpha hydrolase [Anaerolineae bacterium]|nr:adenine nucleotide alpha hydrolase [Anaerolineae bacterium]
MTTPVLVSWSGGKDSLMALWALPEQYRPAALVTHIQTETGRTSVHGVRRELVEAQAAALGLPLHTVELPSMPSNADYEARMEAAYAPFRAQGIKHIVYGDLFLEDIRAYREQHLARMGMEGVYPLWGQSTRTLAYKFIGAGFRAVIACVDTTQLDAAFVGREFDAALLRDLPPDADPCAENGEFHTFAYAGPLFSAPLPVKVGAAFGDGRFRFAELTL